MKPIEYNLKARLDEACEKRRHRWELFADLEAGNFLFVSSLCWPIYREYIMNTLLQIYNSHCPLFMSQLSSMRKWRSAAVSSYLDILLAMYNDKIFQIEQRDKEI